MRQLRYDVNLTAGTVDLFARTGCTSLDPEVKVTLDLDQAIALGKAAQSLKDAKGHLLSRIKPLDSMP
jgi:hypothetical protein